jgi:putative heme-binding domain-containing protein
MARNIFRRVALALALASLTIGSQGAEPTSPSDTSIALLRDWLREESPDESRAVVLCESLVAQANNHEVQRLIADTLARPETTKPVRLLLLEAIEQSSATPCPQVWVTALGRELQHGDLETRWQAISAIARHSITDFDDSLQKLAFDAKETNTLRVAAIAALAARLSPVDPHLFEFLRGMLASGCGPLARLAAAQTLSTLRLNNNQMLSVARSIGESDALVLSALLRTFEHCSNAPAAMSLIIALGHTPAGANVSPEELRHVLSSYPSGARVAARTMLGARGEEMDKQQTQLDDSVPLLADGDVAQGKALFFRKKAACSGCHRVGAEGGLTGPGLTDISKMRSARELLEAILYPSPILTPDYELFSVDTVAGQNYNGIITRLTPSAVWLRNTNRVENKIEVQSIRNMTPSSSSIMPKGLGDLLTKDELRDLLAYLQSLK